jgi:hypothetical protein
MGLVQRVRRAGARAARARTDLADRIFARGTLATGGEQVPLAEGETVRGWLREMGPEDTVLVHRAWGTVAVRNDRREPTAGVFLSDGANAWFAVPPGAEDHHPLTLPEIEHIVLEAMTSPTRPAWPRWVELI